MAGRVLRLKQVQAQTELSRSTIFAQHGVDQRTGPCRCPTTMAGLPHTGLPERLPGSAGRRVAGSRVAGSAADGSGSAMRASTQRSASIGARPRKAAR